MSQRFRRFPQTQTILVPGGTHVIRAGNMHPRAGVRLLGEGYGSHIVARPGLNRSLFRIEQDGVVLADLRIDGNGSEQVLASGNCVSFEQGASHGRVVSCFIEQAAAYNLVAFPGQLSPSLDREPLGAREERRERRAPRREPLHCGRERRTAMRLQRDPALELDGRLSEQHGFGELSRRLWSLRNPRPGWSSRQLHNREHLRRQRPPRHSARPVRRQRRLCRQCRERQHMSRKRSGRDSAERK